MNLLIPMAGAGSRFAEAGYATPKPLIPVTSPLCGEKEPMVVAAVESVPASISRYIFVMQAKHRDGDIEQVLARRFDPVVMLSVEALTEGQASTCLLARDLVDNDQPLFIAACDNGMLADDQAFAEACQKFDALILTYRGHNTVVENPQAYGWVRTDGDRATSVSVKVPISAAPLQDHAVGGSFWFRQGKDFVAAADAMIAADDRVNGEFYVDQVMNHLIARGSKVGVFEVRRNLCWGTPAEYELYEKSYAYWREFLANEPGLEASSAV